MSCKKISLIAGAALVAAGFLGGSIVSSTLAQHGDRDGHGHGKQRDRMKEGMDKGMKGMEKGEMDMQAMMEAWEKVKSPGKQHAKLAKGVGKWDVSMKFWMDPSAPPQESSGTANMKMIMDGRYMVEKFEGTSMGMPFQGMGITAFDNIDQKYKSIWLDNFNTGIMVMEGDANDKGGLTLYSTVKDPMGNTQHMKAVSAQPDDNTVHFKMFKKMADGEWMKEMEIHYTRAN